MLDLTHIREAWSRIAASETSLSSFARDIGFALRRQDDETLRVLRNWLAAAKVDGEIQRGIVQGVLDSVDGYRDALAAEQADEAAVLVFDDGLLKSIVRRLHDRPSTPTAL